ncbi:hypothetical protein SVAN01_09375 [Stagonosporopsis vannaccii]|nr:hypothetical protein SVAN01_09375 [Stagonosporopsis vannaccii]
MATTTRFHKRTYSRRQQRAIAQVASSQQGQVSRKRAKRSEQEVMMPAFERRGVFNFLGLPDGNVTTRARINLADTYSAVRNMIYGYMVMDGTTVLAPKRHSRKSGNASNVAQDYLQFAHVCKQIRWEFFPLWYKPHVIIHGRDFARFVQDFVVYGQFGQSNSAIDVLVPTTRDQGTADFLPFLQYWRNNNNIELMLNIKYTLHSRITTEFSQTIVSPYKKVMKSVVDLLGPGLKPAVRRQWYDFFDKAVMAVVVSYKKGPKIRVVVKSKYEEWWMGTGREDWQKHLRSLEWFRRHGLTSIKYDTFLDVVGPSGR